MRSTIPATRQRLQGELSGIFNCSHFAKRVDNLAMSVSDTSPPRLLARDYFHPRMKSSAIAARGKSRATLEQSSSL
jgi:hypothetical protein